MNERDRDELSGCIGILFAFMLQCIVVTALIISILIIRNL